MRSTYGLNIVYVRCSPIFSTPRCKYPITHSRPRTFSPSRRRITRSTPCVAGCCGPILMTSSFASRNGFSGVSRSRCESEVVWSVIRFSLTAFDSQVDLHPLVILLQDAVIFAQRMSLPSVGQQNTFHVRMSVKLDAEHVEDFALQPVGSRPDGNGTRQARPIHDLSLHADALVARERIKHPDDLELPFARGVVHGGNVDAVIELLFVAEDLENLRNQRTIDHHVVLPGIGQRFDAGTVCALKLCDHGRIPRGGRRGGWLGRRSRFGSGRGRRRWGARGNWRRGRW